MKYKLTDETIEHNGITLYRIQALKDFSNVKAGDLGGWINSEENLSQYGNAWVADEAKVFQFARVCDNALVFGTAEISGDAWVYGNTEIKVGYVR